MNIAWRVTRRDQPQMLSYINLRITGPRLGGRARVHHGHRSSVPLLGDGLRDACYDPSRPGWATPRRRGLMSDSSKAITRRGFAAASAAAFVGFATPSTAAAQEAGDTLRSEFLVDLVFDVGTPLNLGTRQIVPVTGGTFNGPRLKGTALTGGATGFSVAPTE